MNKNKKFWILAIILIAVAAIAIIYFFKPTLLKSPADYDYTYVEKEADYLFDDNNNVLEINYKLGDELYAILSEKYEYSGDTPIKKTITIYLKGNLYENIIEYKYDPQGNLEIYETSSGAAKYLYDERGNLIEETDEFNLTTFYNYDEQDRLICVNCNKNAIGNPITYRYDEKGNLVHIAYGNVYITQEYSPENEVIKMTRTSPEGTETYSYQEYGGLSSFIKEGSEVIYNDCGIIQDEGQVYDEFCNLIKDDTNSYKYDEYGNLVEIRNLEKEELTTQYNYNDYNLLEEIIYGGEIIKKYSYGQGGVYIVRDLYGNEYFLSPLDYSTLLTEKELLIEFGEKDFFEEKEEIINTNSPGSGNTKKNDKTTSPTDTNDEETNDTTPQSSGGRSWKQTYPSDKEKLSTGQTEKLTKDERVVIKINEIDHHVGVIEITESNATLEIASTPKIDTFSIGDEKNFDVNDDGIEDINIKLNSISSENVDLTITRLEASEEKEKDLNQKYTYGIIAISLSILIVLILIIVILIRRKKVKMRNKFFWIPCLAMAIVFMIPLINPILSNQIKVTLEHPFLVDGEWVPASDLQKGQIIENINGEKIKITGIEEISEATEVYNIETGTNNYIISNSDIIVHNSNTFPTSETAFKVLTTTEERTVAAKIFKTRWEETAKALIDSGNAAKIKQGNGMLKVSNQIYNDIVGGKSVKVIMNKYCTTPFSTVGRNPSSTLAQITKAVKGGSPEEITHLAQNRIQGLSAGDYDRALVKTFVEILSEIKGEAVFAANDRHVAIYLESIQRRGGGNFIKNINSELEPKLLEVFNGVDQPQYVPGTNPQVVFSPEASLQYKILYVEDPSGLANFLSTMFLETPPTSP